MRRTAVLTLAAALGAGVLSASAAEAETTALRSVMFVGNNWDGTATIVDAVTHEPLRTIDSLPRHRGLNRRPPSAQRLLPHVAP